MTDRGQLVLVATVLVALAFVPMVLALLQLGYHDDVRASGATTAPTVDARRALAPAVHDAVAGEAGSVAFAQRATVVRDVRRALRDPIRRVERARVRRGTVRRVAYNRSRANEVARARCPGGPGRQFGACEAVDGVVVQERGGWTQVLAVVLDVRATTDDGRRSATWVIGPLQSR